MEKEIHQNKVFLQVLEAPLQSLYELQNSPSLSSVQLIYCKVLIAFLSSDRSQLALLVDEMERVKQENLSDEATVLFFLSKARCEIRERNIIHQTLNQLQQVSLSELPVHLLGETYFVIARGYEVLENHEMAYQFYEICHISFQKCGVLKKSVKALFNALANRTRIDPSLNYISDYKELCFLAMKVKDHGTAAVSLMNISREFEAMGALQLALKYASRALVLQKNDVGSQHHFMTLIHRAHLYLNLQLIPEAERDVDVARLSTHIEIIMAVKYLDYRLKHLNKSQQEAQPLTQSELRQLTKCWQERVFHHMQIKKTVTEPLTSNEEKVLFHLTTQSRKRNNLISVIWGNSEEEESLIQRLKSLFFRIREKRKDLIVFNQGLYKLSSKTWVVYEKNTDKKKVR